MHYCLGSVSLLFVFYVEGDGMGLVLGAPRSKAIVARGRRVSLCSAAKGLALGRGGGSNVGTSFRRASVVLVEVGSSNNTLASFFYDSENWEPLF